MTSEDTTPPARDDRVSLAGPDPLDVLRALLKVDLDAPPVDEDNDEGETPPEREPPLRGAGPASPRQALP